MTKEFTTIPVKKTTHQLVKKMMQENPNWTWDDIVLDYAKNKKDTTKQIIMTVDRDKFYALTEITKILHKMKLIEGNTIEETAHLAINNLIQGMEQGIQNRMQQNPVGAN